MPFYTYYCEANDQTIEVAHPMRQRLKTWGEVCKKANIALGQTPAATPVIRLISRPQPVVWRLKGLDKDDYGKKLRV
jgi:hypothetical protein